MWDMQLFLSHAQLCLKKEAHDDQGIYMERKYVSYTLRIEP